MSFLSLYPKQNYHAHLCGMEAVEAGSNLSTSLGKLEYGIAGNCQKMDGCSPISLLPLTILHLEWMSFLSLYPKQNYHAHLCGMEAVEAGSNLSTSLGKLEYG